jgi:hypothetical protein
MQLQSYLQINTAQICDGACVIAVNVPRRGLANWTESNRVCAGHGENELLVLYLNVGQFQARARRQQKISINLRHEFLLASSW